MRERAARPGARRAGWTLVSQGLSSASNFLLTLFVLAGVGARSFAVFALCLTVYLLLLQLARYVIGIPLLVTHTADAGRDDARQASGVAAAAGLAVAPLLLAAAALWPAGRALLAVLAVTMPLLLAQDALRHAAIAEGRPVIAARGDAVWVGAQLAGMLLIHAVSMGRPSGAVLTAVWALAGSASTVLLMRWLGAPPARWRSARRWLDANGVLCRRVAVEFTVTSGSYYVLCFGLAVLAGSAELGYLRAAQTLFGPASVLLLGGAVLGVPESVRMRGDGARLVRFAALLSAGLAALSVVCGTGVFVMLGRIGPHLFADSWRPIRTVMPWLTGFGAALGAGAGAIAGLRALDRSRWVMRARGMTGAVAIVAGLPASLWFGAKGTFAGLAAAEGVLALRAWVELWRSGGTPVDDEVAGHASLAGARSQDKAETAARAELLAGGPRG